MGEEQHVTETTIDGKSPDRSSSLQFFHFQDHEWWCNKIAEMELQRVTTMKHDKVLCFQALKYLF